MSGQIFISYRREESSAWAGRLSDHLSNHFPSNQIFMDVDSVDQDFVKTIEKTVGSCDVLIAVIGKGWLISCDQEGQRRLDNPEDFVRIEIATALKRDIRVIPVLVDGASMPSSRDLPDDLKALVRRNELQLSHERFRSDSERLLTAVDQALKEARAERRKRGLTFPGKRTWLSVAGMVTVLSLVAAIYFSFHPSKPPEVEVQSTAPVAAVTPSPLAIVTPNREEKATPTPVSALPQLADNSDKLPTFFPPKATDSLTLPLPLAGEQLTLENLSDRLTDALRKTATHLFYAQGL